MAETLTFFPPSGDFRVSDLCDQLSCKLRNDDDGNVIVDTAGPIEAAGQRCLTFIDNPKYVAALKETMASAVICGEKYADQVPPNIPALISHTPYKTFAKAMGIMFPRAMRPQPIFDAGVSTNASVHKTAEIGTGVTIEPGAVIGRDVSIGNDVLIGPNCVIGAGVKIGNETSISAGATVLNSLLGDRVILHSGVRLGCDGFGFAMGPGGHLKIPQIGRVIIQDDVEIGANTCVDRGSNRDTVVGEGTKIDNLVMIGHNVVIGRHCVIVGQTGIAGSATLGDYVVLGGQTAVNGHINIGMGAQIAGLSGVSGDVPPGSQWGGVPARPIKHWMREIGRLRREAMAMEKKKGKDTDG